MTSQPTNVRPVVTAAAKAGPDSRASRPTTTALPFPFPVPRFPFSRTHVPNARAQRVTTSGVRSLPTMPRTPDTPTINVSVMAAI